jgi:hypothetical protein
VSADAKKGSTAKTTPVVEGTSAATAEKSTVPLTSQGQPMTSRDPTMSADARKGSTAKTTPVVEGTSAAAAEKGGMPLATEGETENRNVGAKKTSQNYATFAIPVTSDSDARVRISSPLKTASKRSRASRSSSSFTSATQKRHKNRRNSLPASDADESANGQESEIPSSRGNIEQENISGENVEMRTTAVPDSPLASTSASAAQDFPSANTRHREQRRPVIFPPRKAAKRKEKRSQSSSDEIPPKSLPNREGEGEKLPSPIYHTGSYRPVYSARSKSKYAPAQGKERERVGIAPTQTVSGRKQVSAPPAEKERELSAPPAEKERELLKNSNVASPGEEKNDAAPSVTGGKSDVRLRKKKAKPVVKDTRKLKKRGEGHKSPLDTSSSGD